MGWVFPEHALHFLSYTTHVCRLLQEVNFYTSPSTTPRRSHSEPAAHPHKPPGTQPSSREPHAG